MTALLVGSTLAVASLCYVLWPLYRAEVAAAPRAPNGPKRRESAAVEALRELEFDRQTGKIADADYEALKARYTDQALLAMRAGGRPVCERCGPRPEIDAEYCSMCGSRLLG